MRQVFFGVTDSPNCWANPSLHLAMAKTRSDGSCRGQRGLGLRANNSQFNEKTQVFNSLRRWLARLLASALAVSMVCRQINGPVEPGRAVALPVDVRYQ